MSRWQKKTKRWKQKLNKDDSYLSEELTCGKRYKLILCSHWRRIRSNEKLKLGTFQFNIRRSMDRTQWVGLYNIELLFSKNI